MSALHRWLFTGFACLALGALPALAGPEANEAPGTQSAPTAHVDGPFRVYEQDGWRLEVSIYSGEGSRLIGPPQTAAGATQGATWRPFHHGSDLDAILAAAPALREEAAVKTLLQASRTKDTQEPTYSVWHTRIVSQALSYETWRGAGRAYLIVTADGADHLYEGSDLSAILSAEAKLAAVPGMERIQSILKTFDGLEPRQDAPESPEAVTPMHMCLEMSPQTLRMAIWNKGADSRWQVTHYSGSDFDTLLSAYPSLRSVLVRWLMLDTLDKADEPAQG